MHAVSPARHFDEFLAGNPHSRRFPKPGVNPLHCVILHITLAEPERDRLI
jgi:hypothetical protein